MTLRRSLCPGPWQDAIARQYHKYVAAHGITKAKLMTCSRYNLDGLELRRVLEWIRLANHCNRFCVDLETHLRDLGRLQVAQ